jgi:hypothetical protein
MKQIRKAEYLLAVAIVTSATVMQIRECMLRPSAQADISTLSCGATQAGLAPASCPTARGERPAEGVAHARQAVPRIWV